MPKVFLIILQYNNSAKTLECLRSVQKLKYLNLQVIVVDNGSKPEERRAIEDYLAKHNLAYYFIKNSQNKGYAGGNNTGIRYALKHNADYVAILNNDTVVPPSLIEKLLDIAERSSKVGIVSPIINEGTSKTYGGKITWLSPELHHITKPSVQREPDFLTGACWLIKKEVIENVGFIDERYFLYFEDADYCLRAQKAGYDIVLAHDTLIGHAISSTTKKYWEPSKIFRLHYRNSLLFNRLHGSAWVRMALPFWALYTTIKQLIKLIIMPWKYAISLGIIRGISDYYRSKFGPIS